MLLINFKGGWPSLSVFGRMPVFGDEENSVCVYACVMLLRLKNDLDRSFNNTGVPGLFLVAYKT